MNILKKYVDWTINHKWFVRLLAAAVLVMHVIANTVYMGKPMPVNGIVLTERLAYTNVILAGIFCGVHWGLTLE
jgi:hypothetical protein